MSIKLPLDIPTKISMRLVLPLSSSLPGAYPHLLLFWPCMQQSSLDGEDIAVDGIRSRLSMRPRTDSEGVHDNPWILPNMEDARNMADHVCNSRPTVSPKHSLICLQSTPSVTNAHYSLCG